MTSKLEELKAAAYDAYQAELKKQEEETNDDDLS